MARKFTGDKLVLASHNKGKLREIADLLLPFGVVVKTAIELNLPEPEETGDSFIANAVLKAHSAAQASGLPALADDSGLCIDALDGAPGIYSARWAQKADGTRDFAYAIKRVEQELETRNAQDYHARFVCVLALAWPDGQCDFFEGKVEGTLCFPPRGDRGFGYDPIFIAHGYQQSFGELDPQEKHAISHRADAFAQFIKAVF